MSPAHLFTYVIVGVDSGRHFAREFVVCCRAAVLIGDPVAHVVIHVLENLHAGYSAVVVEGAIVALEPRVVVQKSFDLREKTQRENLHAEHVDPSGFLRQIGAVEAVDAVHSQDAFLGVKHVPGRRQP